MDFPLGFPAVPSRVRTRLTYRYARLPELVAPYLRCALD